MACSGSSRSRSAPLQPTICSLIGGPYAVPDIKRSVHALPSGDGYFSPGAWLVVDGHRQGHEGSLSRVRQLRELHVTHVVITSGQLAGQPCVGKLEAEVRGQHFKRVTARLLEGESGHHADWLSLPSLTLNGHGGTTHSITLPAPIIEQCPASTYRRKHFLQSKRGAVGAGPRRRSFDFQTALSRPAAASAMMPPGFMLSTIALGMRIVVPRSLVVS